MNCTNCGNPMNDGDRFCMRCGFKAVAPVEDAPAAPVEAAPVAPVVEEAPVDMAAPVAAAAAAVAAPVAAMEDRLPEPPPFQPSSAASALEDRLPEPPPFAPGSTEVSGEVAPLADVPEEFMQPVAPPEPVVGTPSAPVGGGVSNFGETTTGAPEAKPNIEDTFQRKSWKDEHLNNGGIVNRGPKN